MADVKPKVAAVHDGQGRMALYLDESLGQDAVLSRFAPRYQQIVVNGEPCTIFFDKHARSFYIGPVYYKQELMDKPGRYDHITDLDWLPDARPDGAAGAAGAAGNVGPINQAGQASRAGQADTARPAAPDGSTERIPYPQTSWSLFMKEKWDEMRNANPNISFGEVSKEASRQWKAFSEEEKASYQEKAVILAGEDGLMYRNSHSYGPAHK